MDGGREGDNVNHIKWEGIDGRWKVGDFERKEERNKYTNDHH